MKASYGKTNPRQTSDGIQRYGSVTGLRPEMERRYRELHANAWDSVLTRLYACNIRNYSILVSELEGKKYLFSYFEHIGEDSPRICGPWPMTRQPGAGGRKPNPA